MGLLSVLILHPQALAGSMFLFLREKERSLIQLLTFSLAIDNLCLCCTCETALREIN
jgi:hypothetical protein